MLAPGQRGLHDARLCDCRAAAADGGSRRHAAAREQRRGGGARWAPVWPRWSARRHRCSASTSTASLCRTAPSPVRVLVPLEEPAGVIVYYHGGGWVIGSIDESDTVGRKLAERTSCTVVLVDYRLAPEHRYPVAVDDSYAALEWVGEHVEEMARQGAPLFVAGDSAGGNLAAVMALRARDRARPTDRGADPDLPGHRRRLRAAVVHRPREPAPADARGDGVVLGPLRAGRRTARRARRLAAARRRPRRAPTRRRADRRARRACATRARPTPSGSRRPECPVNFQRHEGQTHGFFTLLMLPGSERVLSAGGQGRARDDRRACAGGRERGARSPHFALETLECGGRGLAGTRSTRKD